ncbi:MAG: methyltransferase domain-containing protein [Ilumatobacteraceae bacterium]|jgi:SAM-dependent methyltransferase|nr:methyltransferase domain-containing protein [Ilumatobacteraceae bacterium]
MVEPAVGPGPAALRWAERLGEWAVPQHILDQAPVPPWAHDVATFTVDESLDRDTTSARWAREVLPPSGGTVLDVGCGGGRSSLALVPPATELIGVDQSEAMLQAFVEACARAGVARRTVQGRWPDVAPDTPVADVVVCHHVFYNVADLVPFVLALTDHARLAVVVELPPRHPQSALNDAWRHFWGVERPDGPTDADAVAVLREIGLDPEATRSPRGPLARSVSDPAAAVASARRRLCLTPDRDDELAAYLAEHPLVWMSEVTTLRWAGEGTV